MELDKVVNGLEKMLEESKYNDSVNWNPWADTETLEAAIALLKSQEPVAPVQQPDEEYICGACGNGVVGCDVFDEAGIESIKNDYCPTCGRRVKW